MFFDSLEVFLVFGFTVVKLSFYLNSVSMFKIKFVKKL